MSDWKTALKKTGLHGSQGTGDDKCPKCGRPKKPQFPLCLDCSKKGGVRNHPSSASPFPPGYPDYFAGGKVLQKEYVGELADRIAQSFGKGLSNHQLRAFYNYVKQRDAALNNNADVEQVLLEIEKLKFHAHQRAVNEKIPHLFEQFLQRNVDKAKDKDSFQKGFVEHFQAVVAYCAGRIKE